MNRCFGHFQRRGIGRGFRAAHLAEHELNLRHGLQHPVHLLQIWIFPERKGLPPSYEQTHFPPEEKQGQLRLVASRDGREGSVTIHQDAALFVTRLDPGEGVEYAIAPGRRVWVHIATGSVLLNGMSLSAGDGAAVSEEQVVTLEGVSAGETLLFDLA